MRLAQFIHTCTKPITAEWEHFARTCFPDTNLDERRDHIAGMLEAIALDLETPQTNDEQAEKSKGKSDARAGNDTAANLHGTDRAALGYTLTEMVAEFRALRASILRLWSEGRRDFKAEDLEDVIRFNEAIDQALAESVVKYAEEVAYSKELFLGIVGHDLRNPLGAILMAATVMMTQEGPD